MIHRSAEMKLLQNLYEKEGSSLAIVYGNGTSGKEQLIRDFCGDKDVFYYHARHASDERQLSLLAGEVAQEYRTPIQNPTYALCFSAIRPRKEGKLVIVIDEFARIAARNEPFLSTVFRLAEGKLLSSAVMVILSASSVSWIRKDMEEAFGKRMKKVDLLLPLNDLSFLDVVRAFPRYSVSESVKTYGVVGGVPHYLSLWDGQKTVKENVCELILDDRGALHNEAERFIKEGLRELAVYDTILSYMAAGNEKLNELYQVTGYPRAKISVYLKNLANTDIIEKVVSFESGGWAHTKKGVYRIKHHLVDFWFHFIYPHLSDLLRMQPEDFYDAYVEPGINAYLRRYFVDVCKEYVLLLDRVGKLGIHIDKIGTWIGKAGTIDVVGRDATRDCVVCLTNWDAPEMEYDRYEQLLVDINTARLRATKIYLFSATSFAKELVDLAEKDESVVLVDMTEL